MNTKTLPDRGAMQSLRFEVCARGFILGETHRDFGISGRILAFDRIQELADWLVKEYHDAHSRDEYAKECPDA